MADEWITPIPRMVFFTKGTGRHKYRPQSLELAFRHAGIEKFNLVQVSGILPPRCKIITLGQGLGRLQPGQITFGVISESSTDEPNRLLCAGIGVALPIKDQYGYISEHHGYGLTEEKTGDFVEDMAATMLATTLGIEFDPAKNYDERKEIYRMSGNIVRTRNIVQTAEGDKHGLWTTVIAAAVFIMQSQHGGVVGKLGGQVIAITGASSGIGAATALALAPLGVKLVLAARRVDKLEAIAAQCRQLGSQAIAIKCDVAQRADVAALVNKAVAEFGRLDVMIANAGYGFLARIHEATEQEFDEIMNVNVKGTWYAMQEAAPIMLAQKSGHIIAISSGAARISLPLYGIYSMTKACQLSLVQAMRLELRGTGVYVSSVHPLTTTTEFFEVATERSKMRSGGLGWPQTSEKVARRIVGLIRHPRPEVWPRRVARLGLAICALFPRLGDFVMGFMLPRRTR